ncbi:hypothetical protein O8I61_08575, partial [Campylobacter lari]|uniref:hypothetical protein n=1 Tax=Campylobacter lari TaxID=201 RepID=UPI00372B4D00
MKKNIVILALLFSFLFADGCNIPGYLRAEDCQEKNVLFSWKWVLFDSIRSSLPTGFKKIDDNNVTELLNKVSNGTAGLVVNFGTSLHFGTYFRLVDNLVFGANTGIGIG